MATILACFSFSEPVQAGDSSLEWGRPVRSQAADLADESVQRPKSVRDPQVVAAAWDEADTALQPSDEPGVLYIADGRSVVVKRSTIDEAERSFSEERFAQLPEDPFDETPDDGASHDDLFNEPIVEPEIEEAQQALEEEIDRREAEQDYDLFDDPSASESSEESPDESPDDDWLNTDLPRDLDAIDLTPTVEGDDTNLFDSMTLDEEDDLSEGSEESLQYGRELDLSQPPTAQRGTHRRTASHAGRGTRGQRRELPRRNRKTSRSNPRDDRSFDSRGR